VAGGGPSYRHRAWRWYCRATTAFRVQPTFLILGAQRCGTTFLYECLRAQPAVMGAREKEVHFFDLEFHRGLGWYRSHFPASAVVRARAAAATSPVAVGEASPYYLFHPDVPRRVERYLPHARFVVLVRDPVDRAYSHYRHERALGHERLAFEEALEAEERRLAGEEQRLLTDERYVSFAHRHFSYFARGRYAVQLRRWFDRFPRDRFMVLASEALFSDPQATVRRVLRFVGAQPTDVRLPTPPRAAAGPPLPQGTRDALWNRYREQNADLARLVDTFDPAVVWTPP
jgi:Sulfotransferase domain